MIGWWGGEGVEGGEGVAIIFPFSQQGDGAGWAESRPHLKIKEGNAGQAGRLEWGAAKATQHPTTTTTTTTPPRLAPRPRLSLAGVGP